VGSRPTAPTPNLGDQDFLSGLSPLAFGVPTPLLQGNKICSPRQGPLQGAISRSQPNPVFFFSRLLLLPLLLSQPGLGPAVAELEIYSKENKMKLYGARRLVCLQGMSDRKVPKQIIHYTPREIRVISFPRKRWKIKFRMA
jgi:hypothetical protein